MKLFSGLDQIKTLSSEKQQAFERFFEEQKQYKLLPLFGDLSLFMTILGALIYSATLVHKEIEIHLLNYVYTGILISLAIAHRTTKLRHAGPMLIYLIYINMAAFGYLHYLAVGGGIKPIFGILFFMSSLGFVTLSPKHTFIMLGINLTLLFLVSSLLAGSNTLLQHLEPILLNWFTIMSFVVAPVSAFFNRWFFKSIMALQFMLNDRNALLVNTFETLQQTEEKLIHQQKHQALSHMAAGILHEILNPVNCSTQALEYIKGINHDEEIAEALDDALSHQARITNIIEDLQHFSQAHPEHQKEQANISELVNKSLSFCQAELTGIEVHHDISDTLYLPCYPSAMTQVFVNLLLNASTAVNLSESKPAKIEIFAQLINDQYEITFLDNGPGIPEANLKLITEPFYSTSHSPQNAGLGLSICQTILRHHGGELSISSEVGAWTKASIFLPSH